MKGEASRFGDAYTVEQLAEIKAKLMGAPFTEVEEYYKRAYRNCVYHGIKPILPMFVQQLVTAWRVLTIRAKEKTW